VAFARTWDDPNGELASSSRIVLRLVPPRERAVFPQSSLARVDRGLRGKKGLQIGYLLTPSIRTSCAVSNQATEVADLQGFQAL